ncbi:hypothetical protein LTR53_004685 [Teratosphaeriaceae sp. CCFEE 6253]|nr:hypothetical protein LTR53_004685 [Teratosphaeriaceae sp. CCFEE 6253]
MTVSFGCAAQELLLSLLGDISKVMLGQSAGRTTALLPSVPKDRIALSSQRHSDDTLLDGLGFPRVDSEDTLVEHKDMSSPEQAAMIERRRSHGIGGAGNMRKDHARAMQRCGTNIVKDLPSVSKKAEDTPPAAGAERRRTSVWSLASDGSSRRASIVDKIFRRGSKAEEGSVPAVTTS